MKIIERASRIQRGLTLVELMVSMALGLLVVLVASAGFIASKQLFTTDSQSQALQDSSRFASYLVRTIVQQAAYADYTPDVDTRAVASPLTLAPTGSIYDLSLAGATRVGSAVPASAIGYGTNDSAPRGDPGNDSLMVRFFGRADWEAGDSEQSDGTMINCAGLQPKPPGASPSLDDRAWSVFYVAQGTAGEPELFCKYRDDSGVFKSVSVVRGVEVFKVVYGVDTDNDADMTPNAWMDAGQIKDAEIAGAKTEIEKWRRVTAVRIGMVIRSASGAARTGSAPEAIKPLGAEFDDVSFTPRDDGRLRRVVTQTVVIRNPLRAPA